MNISDLNYMEAVSSDVFGGFFNTTKISYKQANVTQVATSTALGFQVGGGPKTNLAQSTNGLVLIQAL